ncbi:hypothetical protein [Roseomonas sp. HF4]|uniref:hypothetical protein n=1 Tax=Roseomonas sp. HF4 TaxID=2562313 RepID=UPI0010C11314|nr:hypothetical protein [Roseomonas sp. HF4]
MTGDTHQMQMLLLEDVLDPAKPMCLPPGPRALYLHDGEARIGDRSLSPDATLFSDAAIEVTGHGTLWRFEVARRPPDWTVPPEDRARLLLARPLARDPSLPFVLRLDRVDFIPNADTPAHGHYGQGIRRLLAGRLLLRIGDRVERRHPGEAWFETGQEPVTARGLVPETAFIRALVMDTDMQGRSSFLAWTPEDAAAPRNVTYRLFLDELTRLP